MTPERHQQIKRLFLAAVELTPPEAKCFLDEACGEDNALRGEVQSMLDHHTEATLLPTEANAANATQTTAMTTSGFTAEGTGPTAEPPVGIRPPGTIIAGRYRLVAPLGHGGMGVVYRAEDLELNQTIALKFLNPRLKDFAGAVDMVRREVRIARQITHPNVVRIFDIGTAEGELFISMEYIAGEDLGSLVRRVGRLTPDKLLQVARQLAGGLAAAHDRGILHRDLKPANVMIDDAGNVRILDFGIAAPLDDQAMLKMLMGTPGFVAPELLHDQPPTVQSDLYTWGLVVYYAATGRLLPAAEAPLEAALDSPNFSSSAGPELADVIRKCLDPAPDRRPRSAHDLTVALAASDPLLAAVKAGRVPPPDLLMASHSWQATRRLIDGLFASGLLLLALVVALADRTMFFSRCGLLRSPEVLQEIAVRNLAALGHAAPQQPVLTGVGLDTDALQFIRSHPELRSPWQSVHAGKIPAVFYWYRQGDPRLPRPAPLGEPAWERTVPPIPGTASVRLDGSGRLLTLQVAVDALDDAKPSTEPIDWLALLKRAGFTPTDFGEIAASSWPPLFADEVRCWEGPFPADPQLPLRITAAALQGKVVYFDVDQPWEQSRSVGAATSFRGQKSRFVSMRTAVWLIAIVLAAALAWHNVGRANADWVGAWRIAVVVTILAAIEWLLDSRHTFVAAEELTVGFLWLSVIVFSGVAAAVAYLAVDSPARRWWPWSIITTRRLLAGRLNDRDIWADVLLGIVVGLVAVSLRQFSTLTNQLLSLPVSGLNDFDFSQDLVNWLGLRFKVSVLITALLAAILDSLLILALVVGLKRMTRSTPAAAILLVTGLALLAVLGRGVMSPADWLARTLLWVITACVLIRGGLLAATTALTTFYAVNDTPITLDLSAWFAPIGVFVVVTLAIGLMASWRLARPSSDVPLPET
jgi:protein kinase-like protein